MSESSRLRSGQEQDLLVRSTKKIKRNETDLSDEEDEMMGDLPSDLPAEQSPHESGAGGIGDGTAVEDTLKTGEKDEKKEAEVPAVPNPSFRDMLLGENKWTAIDEEDEFGPIGKNDGLIQFSTVNNWPSLTTTDKLRTSLERRWHNCLIVKLLGRSIGFQTLDEKIKRLWGEYELIDLGTGYFLVKFTDVYDLQFALEEGPWILFGHY